jgi:hypothetical protein
MLLQHKRLLLQHKRFLNALRATLRLRLQRVGVLSSEGYLKRPPIHLRPPWRGHELVSKAIFEALVKRLRPRGAM